MTFCLWLSCELIGSSQDYFQRQMTHHVKGTETDEKQSGTKDTSKFIVTVEKGLDHMIRTNQTNQINQDINTTGDRDLMEVQAGGPDWVLVPDSVLEASLGLDVVQDLLQLLILKPALQTET